MTDWSRWAERLAQQEVALDVALRRIVEETARVLGADRGTLYLVDRVRGELVSRVAQLPEVAEIRLRLGEGAAGWVAANKRPLRSDHTDARFAQRVDAVTGYRTQTLLAIPLVDARGDVVGVLQLLNRQDGVFTAEDEAALVEIGEQVAHILVASSLGAQLGADQRNPLSFGFNHLVGVSAPMQAVFDQVTKVAPTEATVLLRGESGTGKEGLARAAHFNSARADGPLVKIDCAALPENLIENELFGHEKGAYTSAEQAQTGKVAQADGGTLFLDEVGELPVTVQAKLLRLLQDRAYLPVGGTRVRQADVRFVCATHLDLEAAVRSGRMRQDLYYRLRVVEVRVPPLRERGHADLDQLIDHFLHRFRVRHRRPTVALSDAARRALHTHPWPGNVRELEHCIERAVVLAGEGPVPAEALGLVGAAPDGTGFSSGLVSLRELEQRYVRWAVERCGGNLSEAARTLEIGRNTLKRKLE